jgi:hypothetical protein
MGTSSRRWIGSEVVSAWNIQCCWAWLNGNVSVSATAMSRRATAWYGQTGCEPEQEGCVGSHIADGAEIDCKDDVGVCWRYKIRSDAQTWSTANIEEILATGKQAWDGEPYSFYQREGQE